MASDGMADGPVGFFDMAIPAMLMLRRNVAVATPCDTPIVAELFEFGWTADGPRHSPATPSTCCPSGAPNSSAKIRVRAGEPVLPWRIEYVDVERVFEGQRPVSQIRRDHQDLA